MWSKKWEFFGSHGRSQVQFVCGRTPWVGYYLFRSRLNIPKGNRWVVVQIYKKSIVCISHKKHYHYFFKKDIGDMILEWFNELNISRGKKRWQIKGIEHVGREEEVTDIINKTHREGRGDDRYTELNTSEGRKRCCGTDKHVDPANDLSLVSLFNGISTLFRLFNAKAILLEEQ